MKSLPSVEESSSMKTATKLPTPVNQEQYYAKTADVSDVFVKTIWPVIVHHALFVMKDGCCLTNQS